VLVVSNAGAARTVRLQLGDMAALIPLKTKSLTTLAWK